ncbi:SDR family NAD(P)-dependent oxidoreductase [Amycolatopsis taiwanensis]|uniref:Short chain dehydrogenase/reductase n=1 Tax=Amycolatopsis taiwanensis TaxID=342230 RepID=A0A9W6R578_9PSEU|nr:SDR family NAD(P)-dependent oxidoreductase [Amycolatopsis taiwanensis]GLY67847.1 putative short chain dehydrogenase/reductase [Amycolatopsis taiwanensis]
MTTRNESPVSGPLTGRIAIVTGAARGIGRAAAIALSQAGADVAGIDIATRVSPILDFEPATVEDLSETGRLVRAAGGRWLQHVADQREIAQIRAIAETVEREWGGVDVVFANAGIQAFKPLLEMSDPDWYDQIDVNLHGTANVLRVFAPLLVRRGGGRIIVTSSTQGQHGTKFGSSYSASKWGIIGLMKSAALELGAHNITVNAVIPGLIDTALTRHEGRYAQAIIEAGQVPSGDASEDERRAVELLKAKTPLGVPWLEPADVAPLIVFLASDQARMISGTSFAATGGDSAHVTA